MGGSGSGLAAARRRLRHALSDVSHAEVRGTGRNAAPVQGSRGRSLTRTHLKNNATADERRWTPIIPSVVSTEAHRCVYPPDSPDSACDTTSRIISDVSTMGAGRYRR